MDWARIRPLLGGWPGGGEPPVFEVTADGNGDAVIELAWDPAALMSPADYQPPQALRYYSTDVDFNVTITRENGPSMAIRAPVQQIRLTGGRARWVMPKSLWDGYVEESLKSLNNPPTSQFQRSIYYRVRVTPTGSSNAVVWPSDNFIQNQEPTNIPLLSVLPLSATPSSQVVPDQAAVQAMGGVPPFFPNLWGDVLLSLWRSLPESDSNRRALAQIFDHPNFRGIQEANLRGKILTLWLFAGHGRPKIPRLLDRQIVIGSNLTEPALLKRDLRGSRPLVENLLALLGVTPHPDITITSQEQLLDDVITEILDPNGQVNQGDAGTCSPTSMQTLMIMVNPAEYARLQLGLLSTAGSAQLSNGSRVTIPPAILQLTRYPLAPTDPFYVRTYSELAFQAAILKYAQGSRFPTYDPSAPPNSPNSLKQVFQTTIKGGLGSNETKRGLDGLFNVNFTIHYVPFTSNTATQAAQPAILRSFLQNLPQAQQPLPLAMFWSQPYNFGHAVLAIRRDNARVFFKNPQYAGSQARAAAGSTANNPPRRYEDPSGTLESVSESDLQTWIKGYWVPDHAIG
jgi:hypothetical protein